MQARHPAIATKVCLFINDPPRWTCAVTREPMET